MSKSDLSKSYATHPQPGNPRATEAWALTQAALRMTAGKDAADPEQLKSAVRLNWRLWTILQAELLDPECLVPIEIRTNMLSLARFVDKRTVDYFSAPDPKKTEVLIAINRELAGGLYTTPKEATPLPPQPAVREPLRVST
jgi:flagellar biosynthesis activator protein FlaF